ncbi:peptidase S1 [Chroococcidiopsis sp. CCALA 051]|uniref:S1C family serine protease n=1 Tax=Chroococcidiopsis sp. CCALA 051 TaxID=869949 RepID=UPI000D0CBDF7|nr:trypsin-like peptidase domain-containing protein [Chroococcidiopsis sp. CCALA 051]MBE9018497.1 trypsin-like peptidase domain-containing protein [Chroococcidiopsidales cyanobacterium LEGE 13417]PSM47665.1 peptidase S1 [Chroococcidiopsis sp. CCALA 051]PSM47676.1 peptidase S1 [Chroococcidiopsis sp. CCALA 051]
MTTLNDELASVAAALSRSTVQIQDRRFGGGSGVIWQADGVIITNAHVIRSDRPTVKLADNRVLDAVCTNRDRLQDLAVLKVDATDLPAAPIGDSDTLRVGQMVFAVGNPLGITNALTTGIIHTVSSKNQTGKNQTAKHQTGTWIQADIRLRSGNSGGALADTQGKVIGINTAIAGGLGLAIPSNIVERFLRRGTVKPYLGVTLQPVAIGRRYRRRLGLLILAVQADSLAESAGLLTGDVLTGVAGRGFTDISDLAEVLWQFSPGDLLQLNLIRAGKSAIAQIQIPDKSGAVAA